jgi:hypothetical protein
VKNAISAALAPTISQPFFNEMNVLQLKYGTATDPSHQKMTEKSSDGISAPSRSRETCFGKLYLVIQG